jgi:hypothetical protein
MKKIAVTDSANSMTIEMDPIDAMRAVTKSSYRYSLTPVARPDDELVITVGDSPFTWVHNIPTAARMTIFVQGGTVSKIEVGRRGTFVDTGVIAGEISIGQGDSLRITHTGAPTVTALPH